MAKKSLYLFGIVLAIILGTMINWKLCCDTTVEAVTAPIAKKAEVPINPLYIKDNDGSFSFEDNDNFNFDTSGFNVLLPISDGVQRGIDSLKSHLASNPAKFIEITGYHATSENNTSAFPNLGLARATHIKNYLVSRGISSKQIITKGEEKDDLVLFDETYSGPVKFAFATESDLDDVSLKALEASIKDHPIKIYFNFGESQIELTEEQRQKVSDISKYLDKVEGAVCNLIGHTDNTSSAEFNYGLGIRRAEFIKEYFIAHGIPASKITTASKGETEPIADNTTEEGRAQNRRTIVTINKP